MSDKHKDNKRELKTSSDTDDTETAHAKISSVVSGHGIRMGYGEPVSHGVSIAHGAPISFGVPLASATGTFLSAIENDIISSGVLVSSSNLGLQSSYLEYQKELLDLRRRVEEQQKDLQEQKTGAKENTKKLEATVAELQQKQRIDFLLARVKESAQVKLLGDDNFAQLFLKQKECIAIVMSVDIRRSTELMLKARSPEAFAHFITDLCADLIRIVKSHYGVFDKFTGDGILAFYPDFYSGDDAAYHAIAAAEACHASFRCHYKKHRRSFSSILIDVGLGIGVDFGRVHLVQMAGGYTVVGGPVVYACRLSGAPAASTYLNQPAYEIISDHYGAACFVEERSLEIKHEGQMLAYQVRLSGREYTPGKPDWESTAAQPLGSKKSGGK